MRIQSPKRTYVIDEGHTSTVLKKDGKFGTTYGIYIEETKEDFILKCLNPSLAKDGKAVGRFKREAAVRIPHPNLAQPFEYFIFEGNHYLVREFVNGKDLREFSRKSAIEDIVISVIQAAQALQALHGEGIIHRDVRPANIIALKAAKVHATLIDLGLAKLPDDDPSEKSPFSLIYSPPEQVMNCGAAVNASSDLYSLGITLYECITGKVPFYHENPEMMMQLMINMPLEKDKKIPELLWKIITKATSKYKFPLPPNKYKKDELLKLMLKGQEGRYHSAQEMSVDLSAALEETGRQKKVGFFKRLFKRGT